MFGKRTHPKPDLLSHNFPKKETASWPSKSASEMAPGLGTRPSGTEVPWTPVTPLVTPGPAHLGVSPVGMIVPRVPLSRVVGRRDGRGMGGKKQKQTDLLK